MAAFAKLVKQQQQGNSLLVEPALGAVRASNRAAKYIDTEPSGSSRREESI